MKLRFAVTLRTLIWAITPGTSSRSCLKAQQPDPGEYLIEFWRATGNAFLKGHRIRVEISSSDYSFYLRNLNTGADNLGLETSHVVAQQTIHHDAAFARRIAGDTGSPPSSFFSNRRF